MSLVTDHPDYVAARQAEDDSRYADMLRHAASLVETFPGRALSCSVMGDANRCLGLNEQALSWYRRAKACDEDADETPTGDHLSDLDWPEMPDSPEERQRFNALTYQLLHAIERADAMEAVSVGIGPVRREQGDHAAAIESFRKVMTEIPGRLRAWNETAQIYCEQRRADKVVETYERFVAVVSDDPIGWQLLAVSYLDVGRPRDSVRAIKQSLALDEQTAENYWLMGVALNEMALHHREVSPRFEQTHLGFVRGVVLQTAIQAYRQALELDPRHDKARSALARTQRLVDA